MLFWVNPIKPPAMPGESKKLQAKPPRYNELECARTQQSIRGFYMNRLAYTSWECKYHIILAPKFRRQAIYEKLKVEIGIRDLCDRKGIEITAA